MTISTAKVLLYTNCEADEFKTFPYDLCFEDFLNIITERPDIKERSFKSEALGQNISSKGIDYEGLHVFAVFFSNGMIYEIGRGFRPQREKEFINQKYNQLR